jgi:hypothetical protein
MDIAVIDAAVARDAWSEELGDFAARAIAKLLHIPSHLARGRDG